MIQTIKTGRSLTRNRCCLGIKNNLLLLTNLGAVIMKNIFFAFFAFTFLLFLSNCQKVDFKEQVQKQIEVLVSPNILNVETTLETVNGILKIESDAQLVQLMEFISTSNDDMLNKWEEELGFESLRHISDDAYEIASSVKNLKEFESTIQNYSEYITVKELSGEKELVCTCESRFFSSLANSKGLFVTGSTVNRILGDYILSTDFNNVNLLEVFTLSNVSVLKLNNVRVQNTRQEPRLKTNCSNSFSSSVTVGDYRVKTEGYIQSYVLYYDPYPYSTCIDGVQITTGYKKNFLGIWVKHDSDLAQGGHGTIIYNLNYGGDVTLPGTFPYYLESDHQDIECHHRWATLDSNLTSMTMYLSHFDVWGSSSNVPTNVTASCGS